LTQLRNLIAIPLFDIESEGGAMVHEKQIRNEENAALLNQNTGAGTVPRVLYRCPKERRLLENFAPTLKCLPVFTKYFHSFNPNIDLSDLSAYKQCDISS
jgi:hypothetical protein